MTTSPVVRSLTADEMAARRARRAELATRPTSLARVAADRARTPRRER
jgi:hypothetical protein